MLPVNKEGGCMGKVITDMSISLDGYIAGPNDDVDRLHQWGYDLASWRKPHGLEGGETGRDDEVMEEYSKNVGAVVMGRRMFDLGEPHWGDNPPFHNPVFVVTHRARPTLVKEGGTTFTFVTDGIKSALAQAKAAAGDQNVSIAGGADIIQQVLQVGLLNEIQLHLIPVLLGDGVRLFDRGADQIELETTRVMASPGVTHLKFGVIEHR
jgi:dihydrofolate reductase